ncbi:MAG: AAA family ATPase [Minisyncoccia bacterium]
MIKKIVKIKNYSVFQDFSWNLLLPDFKKVNIIYGFNGSGKSTLSELFRFLEIKNKDFLNTGVEFDIEIDGGNHIKNTGTNLFTKDYQIKVFNQSFVGENIDFIQGKTKKITLFLGKENQELRNQLEDKTNRIDILGKEIEDNLNEQQEKEKSIEKSFTEIAKTISAIETGNARRNYRSPEAKLSFNLLQNKQEIDEAELEQNKKILTAEKRENIPELSAKKYKIEIETIKINIDRILKTKILISIIKRLKDNFDISQWVESGLAIHKDHNSRVCEYCLQKIPNKRQKELEEYFNDANKKLKTEIDSQIKLIDDLYSNIESIIIPDENKFYPDKKQSMITYKSIFIKKRNNILLLLDEFKSRLEEKKGRQFEKLVYNPTINNGNQFDDVLDSIEALIKSHNVFNDNLEKNIDEARKKIETHYLSTIFDEVKNFEVNIKELEAKVIKDKKNKDTIREEADTIRGKISNVHASCDELNRKIHQFLGRDEINLEVTADQQGFTIKRKLKNATNLSEGEKTAIAFVYFLESLSDNGLNAKDEIIVIDDPVSSFDSNSLFQAFAFMKELIEDPNQIFIMTHNFQFLRLVLNWQKGNNRGKDCSSYMINNYMNTTNIRCARIEKLDKLLESHETEYHYLFKLLYEFNTEADEKKNDLARVYNLPNIARKVLETYLMFRVPSNQGTYDKLYSSYIKFDRIKKAAIYKFSNDQSHITGDDFSPSLIQETKNNIRDLLDMIQQNSQEHYEIIVSSLV